MSGNAQTNRHHASAQTGATGEFDATLSKSLDARKSKPGDKVTATTTQDIRSGREVIVPEGSKLIGHVTGARRHARRSSSELGVVLGKAILKSGREVPLDASIEAIASDEAAASSGFHDVASESPGFGAAGGGAMGAGGVVGGGGLVGGVADGVAGGAHALGGLTGAGGVAGRVGGSAGAMTSGTAAAISRSPGAIGGLDSMGRLTAGSHGVFGLQGLDLQTAGAEGSMITSTSRDVRLDRGTRMLLKANAVSSVAASATGRASTH